jgi:hypothetical protein
MSALARLTVAYSITSSARFQQASPDATTAHAAVVMWLHSRLSAFSNDQGQKLLQLYIFALSKQPCELKQPTKLRQQLA